MQFSLSSLACGRPVHASLKLKREQWYVEAASLEGSVGDPLDKAAQLDVGRTILEVW